MKNIGIGIGIVIVMSLILVAVGRVPSDSSNTESNTQEIQKTVFLGDVEKLFPRREQIGTQPTFDSSEKVQVFAAGEKFDALQKYYSKYTTRDTLVALIKFNSVNEAFDIYQKEKETSFQEGGFEYFDISVQNADCYGENGSTMFLFKGFCVKDNIYFKVFSKLSFTDVRKFSQYVADNFD